MRSVSPPSRRSRTATRAPRPNTGRVGPLLAVVGAALLAYHNTFQNPFIFDDVPRIATNPLIRHLWPPWEVLSGTSRPLVQLTLALNHAVSGTDPWSYHAVNLAIHVLAGLTLLGVIRRTLAGREMPDRIRSAATGLGLAATLIWVVHPLQTEAVTYVIQRAESLAGALYLGALYGVIRGADSARSGRWYAAAVACCGLGMASKPVVATAPLAILLYDRMFLAGSLRELWRRRHALYIGLFASLGLLPLMFANGPLDWRTSSGLGVPGVTPLSYAMTQPGVILHYIRLCLWPHSLCLDYGWPIARQLNAVVAPALVVLALASLGAWLSWRGRRFGFPAVWFFLVLAPTSSFIPILDPAFEHRLYLPLAGVSVLATVAGFEALRWLARRFEWSAGVARGAAIGATLTLVATLATLTVRRNTDYRDAGTMWADVVAKRPGNARARTNLAMTLLGSETEKGLGQLREAVRIDPSYWPAHLALGHALTMMGRAEEALPHAREAVRLDPENGEARFLLGVILLGRGAFDEAHAQLTEALRYEPERPASHYNMGIVLERLGRLEDAIQRYSEAVKLRPDYASAHCNLGLALASAGRIDEARRELETALALEPGSGEARQGLADLGRPLDR